MPQRALAQAGLRLDSRAAALQGGLSGPALVPGNGQGSLIVKRLLGKGGGIRMPQNMEPWPTERIALVRRWIDEGAPWPESTATAAVTGAPSPAAPAIGPQTATVVATTTANPPDFVKDVAPIFRQHCVSCHGPPCRRAGCASTPAASLCEAGSPAGSSPQGAARRARWPSACWVSSPRPCLSRAGRCPRPRSRSSAPGSTRARPARTMRLPTPGRRATGPTRSPRPPLPPPRPGARRLGPQPHR